LAIVELSIDALAMAYNQQNHFIFPLSGKGLDSLQFSKSRLL